MFKTTITSEVGHVKGNFEHVHVIKNADVGRATA
jgi:hypothetical protein